MTPKEKTKVHLTEDTDSTLNVTGHTHLVAFYMSLWSIQIGLSDRIQEPAADGSLAGKGLDNRTCFI